MRVKSKRAEGKVEMKVRLTKKFKAWQKEHENPQSRDKTREESPEEPKVILKWNGYYYE
jgi:hypothetical protein